MTLLNHLFFPPVDVVIHLIYKQFIPNQSPSKDADIDHQTFIADEFPLK